MSEIQDVTPTLDDQFEDGSSSEEINFNDLNLESSIEGGSKKPIFEENTLATVVEVHIKKVRQIATTRDGSDTYTPLIVNIVTQTDDGKTSYDNYNGLRLTSDGNLWCGETSQFGNLVALIKEEKKGMKTFEDIFGYLKEGLRVKIRTREFTYNNKITKKNIITQLI